MTTPKQLAANQTNAHLSTGPQTEPGKRRSALNAVRHGLTGQVVLLPHEDREAFHAFSQSLLAELDVDAAHERALADLYIGTLWKLQRAGAIEENLYTLGLVERVAGNLNLEDPRLTMPSPMPKPSATPPTSSAGSPSTPSASSSSPKPSSIS